MALVILGVSSAIGAMVASDTTPRTSVSEARGILTAQTKATTKSRRSTPAPGRGAEVQLGSSPGSIYFSCDEKKCNCSGGPDCFDLGSKDLCGSWDCTGNNCSCTKKAK
jgi:hypothetical protein